MVDEKEPAFLGHRRTRATGMRQFSPGEVDRMASAMAGDAVAQTAVAPARRTAATALGSTWKSCKNSSKGTPSSIQSKSCWTGRRVPRKQGTPLMRAGSTQTASSSDMERSRLVLANVFMGVVVRTHSNQQHRRGYAWDGGEATSISSRGVRHAKKRRCAPLMGCPGLVRGQDALAPVIPIKQPPPDPVPGEVLRRSAVAHAPGQCPA